MEEMRYGEIKQLAPLETRSVLGIIPFTGDFPDWRVEITPSSTMPAILGDVAKERKIPWFTRCSLQESLAPAE